MLFFSKVEKIYRGMVFIRFDESGLVYYLSHKDFDGLCCEPYPFKSFAGDRLSGYIYSYGKPSFDRVIVFDHGIASGHRGYMREIEKLAKNGYTVFAYDHTGCMESEGASANGLCQSLCDLDACLTSLKADKRFKKTKFSVMGHSWGGFSTMNIVKFHPDITHAVCISGFISVKQMVRQSLPGLLRLYYNDVYNIEQTANPKYIECDATEILKNTPAKTLLIYSDNDRIVRKKYHFDPLEKALADAKNVELMLVSGKKHNPNYTESAVKYKDAFFNAMTRKLITKNKASDKDKADFTASYDWFKMTEQDDAVWDKIFTHLSK